MKIAVIGAGSLGSLFGGLLAADGNDAWLLHHREEYAAALGARGVSIKGWTVTRGGSAFGRRSRPPRSARSTSPSCSSSHTRRSRP